MNVLAKYNAPYKYTSGNLSKILFDVLDDDTDVFNTLRMFTETKNGLGWK